MKPEFKPGEKIGKWTVITPLRETVLNRYTHLCRCECGLEREIYPSNLTHKRTTQCKECYRKEWRRKRRENGSLNNFNYR